MRSPGRLPLYGDRWTALVETWTFIGIDLTGATFALQVRDRPDGGFVRADLGTVASASAEGVRLIAVATDTVANHIVAGLLDEVPPGYSSGSVVTLSIVGLRINESTMEAMEAATEVGSDAEIHWDLHITPAGGGTKQRYLYGPFIVRAGVTQ